MYQLLFAVCVALIVNNTFDVKCISMQPVCAVYMHLIKICVWDEKDGFISFHLSLATQSCPQRHVHKFKVSRISFINKMVTANSNSAHFRRVGSATCKSFVASGKHILFIMYMSRERNTISSCEWKGSLLGKQRKDQGRMDWCRGAGRSSGLGSRRHMGWSPMIPIETNQSWTEQIVQNLSRQHRNWTQIHSQKKEGTKAVTGAVPFQKVHFLHPKAAYWYILAPKMYILAPEMYILVPKMYI